MRLRLALSSLAIVTASLTGCAGPATPPPSPDTAVTAWTLWDNGDVSRTVPLDDTRPYRVDFIGAGDTHPGDFRALTDSAIPAKDGLWYHFRVTYLPTH